MFKLICPYCRHEDIRVVDSRDSGDEIRRRRECSICLRRFTTYERVQTRIFQVVKKDQRREELNTQKLLGSLFNACAKRPLPVKVVEKISKEIETEIMNSGRSEISSKIIGDMVMDHLRKLDRVAYIRYASVYRSFQDIETFKNEIDALLDPQPVDPEMENQLSFLPDTSLGKKGNRRRGRPRKESIPAS